MILGNRVTYNTANATEAVDTNLQTGEVSGGE